MYLAPNGTFINFYTLYHIVNVYNKKKIILAPNVAYIFLWNLLHLIFMVPLIKDEKIKTKSKIKKKKNHIGVQRGSNDFLQISKQIRNDIPSLNNFLYSSAIISLFLIWKWENIIFAWRRTRGPLSYFFFVLCIFWNSQWCPLFESMRNKFYV